MKRRSILMAVPGIAGVLTLWSGLVIAINKSGLELLSNTPLSDLGINPASARIFSVSLIVSALFFSVFGLLAWQRYKAGRVFFGLFILAQACQALTGVIPYGGTYRIAHTSVAFVLAACLPVFMYLFARSRSLGALTKFSKTIAGFELVGYVLGMTAFLLVKHGYPLSQAVIALAYHIWIIAVSIDLTNYPASEE